MNTPELLTCQEVLHLTGIRSRTTIWRRIQTGKFATQRQFRAAVLESELRLPPHQGYLLLPDGLPVARIALTADHIARRGSPREPAYVPGDPASTLWSKVGEIAAAAATDARPGPV